MAARIGRRFDYADQGDFAPIIVANRAQLGFAKSAAAAAMPDILNCGQQRPGQPPAAITITLQQMEGHPLGGLGTYPGQATQRRNQLLNKNATGHSNRS